MRVFALFPIAIAFRPVTGAIDFRAYLNNTPITVPNSYIVSLKPGSHLKRGFSSPHTELYHDLTTRGIEWQVTREYDSPVMTGSVVRLDREEDLAKLTEARGVESVTPVYIHPPPKPVLSHTVNARGGAAPGGVYPPHQMTGVDKLHRLGYFGRGIKVAVIDSGVDYTHPALGGRLGPQYKVIGGWDFAGDGYTGDPSTARPSRDPIDHCNGHGTHVAGIIAASPKNPFGISGVAYHARINAYRIFGCKGGVGDDLIIAALIRAFKDGNDVLNLSLGGTNGWTSSTPSVVASRIARAGRAVVIAAGNEGQYGAWYTASPSSGLGVMSIGSINNLVLTVQLAIVSNGRKIMYQNNDPLKIPAGLPLHATSSDTNAPADACEPLPQGTPDLSNKLVIIRRGTCTFDTKINNVGKFGARYFLIYDNAEQPLIELSNGAHTIALISQADGRFLISEGIPKGLTVSFPYRPKTIKDPDGGLTSYFSTYGPTNDMYMKPALSAPGGNILSTWPQRIGSYKVQSGTSMAAPYVAGAAALYLQIKGRSVENSQAALVAFQNTARPVPQTWRNRGMLETAAHQGAGLIQVYDAIRATSHMYPPEILLNDTVRFRSRRRVFIRNRGKRAVVYTLHHQPAGTARTIEGIENNLGPVPLVSGPARTWVSARKVYVPAGWTIPVTVWFRPPTGVDPKSFPVYSGYIQARGTDGSVMQSSYLGVAAPMKSMKVLDNTPTLLGNKLPFLIKNGQPVYEPTTYTFQNGDVPGLVARLVAGTPAIQIDLIDWRAKILTNQRRSGGSSYESSFHNVSDSLHMRSAWGPPCPPRRGCPPGGTFALVKTVGLLGTGDLLSRNVRGPVGGPAPPFLVVQFPVFANGSQIPNGNYKVLVRALKITGDRTREEDYEVWTSQVFAVRKR